MAICKKNKLHCKLFYGWQIKSYNFVKFKSNHELLKLYQFKL